MATPVRCFDKDCIQLVSRYPKKKKLNPEAESIVPDWVDKVNFGIGLSYLPVRLQRLAGRYENHLQELTISPIRDYEFGL
jgi:hypothetical protein